MYNDKLDTVLYAERNKIIESLLDFENKGVINGNEKISVSSQSISFTLGTTAVTIVRPPIEPLEIPKQIEQQTGITLEANSDILLKKIVGRILDWGSSVDRDIYDLLIASRVDLASLEYVHQSMRPQTRHQFNENLRGLNNQTPKSPSAQRPILYPTYLIENSMESLLRLFTSELTDLPKISKFEKPPPTLTITR